MPNETFVVGLNGREIINDILEQIKKALQSDCNLRETDSYSQGYSGKFSIELKLVAVDTTVTAVSTELKATPALEKAAEEAAKKAAEDSDPTKVVEQFTKVITASSQTEIPQELDLNTVRERSSQPLPLSSIADPQRETAPAPEKRTYGVATGGALDGAELGPQS